MLKEFREFAMKGNVVDMAIGVIIGGAFGKIVSSMVSDILMPPIGKIMGNVDFSNKFIDLSGASYTTLKSAKDAGAATINYGLFINTILDFAIVAFVLFLVVKQMNRLKKQEAPGPATSKDCPQCCMSIPIAAVRCGHCTTELRKAA